MRDTDRHHTDSRKLGPGSGDDPATGGVRRALHRSRRRLECLALAVVRHDGPGGDLRRRLGLARAGTGLTRRGHGPGGRLARRRRCGVGALLAGRLGLGRRRWMPGLGSRRVLLLLGRAGDLADRSHVRRSHVRRCARHARPCRQDRQRVDVSVLVGRDSYPQMHVGRRLLGLAARTDGPDDVALEDLLPPADGNGPEVNERHGVAVVGADRDGQASARNGACKADQPRRRCAHGSIRSRSDIDATVLAPGVGIASELNGCITGPSTGQVQAEAGAAPTRNAKTTGSRTPMCLASSLLPVVIFENEMSVAGWADVVKNAYSDAR